jgi:hypothetical protein
MESNDESDGQDESRRPSTTSTTGTLDSNGSDNSDGPSFSANDNASRWSSIAPLSEARTSDDRDGEIGRHETAEKEEYDVPGK